MAQNDLIISNQSFPSFRTDLNNALLAIQTTHSGTTTPTNIQAGQIWLDTTSATTPTLKYYDGADNISLATLDHSANTVNWLDSTVSITGLTTTATGTVLTLTDTHLNSTVSVRLPTGTGIHDDSGNEYVKFSKTASAVNEFTVANSATANAPELSVTGSDTNIDLKITPKGTGKIILDGLAFPNADGTASQVLQTNGSGVLSFSTISAAGKFESALLHVRDEKAANTSGGAGTTGAFTKRDLNTVVTNEISGASLSSSVITLPSGTYYAFGSSPAYNVNQLRIKLRNTSDSTDTLLGTTEYNNDGAYSITRSFVTGRFTIASSKNFELQYRISANPTGNALGTPNNFGITEVYADVQIWKVA